MSSKKLIKRNKIISFGEKIRQVREDHGLNKADFADMLGWSRPQVTKYENGTELPGLEKLLSFSHKFNVNLNWFICDIGVKYIPRPDIFLIPAKSLLKNSGKTYNIASTTPLPDDQPNNVVQFEEPSPEARLIMQRIWNITQPPIIRLNIS